MGRRTRDSLLCGGPRSFPRLRGKRKVIGWAEEFWGLLRGPPIWGYPFPFFPPPLPVPGPKREGCLGPENSCWLTGWTGSKQVNNSQVGGQGWMADSWRLGAGVGALRSAPSFVDVLFLQVSRCDPSSTAVAWLSVWLQWSRDVLGRPGY